MDVRLLNHTPDPERAIAAAARLCYAPVGAAELAEKMSDEDVRKVLRQIMRSGHFSALEHGVYTFALDDVSRAMTHQLVRHRLASYNQQSQRYVRFEDGLEFVRPDSVSQDTELATAFDAAMRDAMACYRSMLEAGVPAEDARYVLPNAAASRMVVTMNVRELLHFFTLRCCNRAQWEIRDVARAMLDLVEPTAPYVFMDAGASCRRGPCPEGTMTCGDPYARAPVRE
jgi:thymidylate synthase (FAD)